MFRPKISYPPCNHSLEEIFSRSASSSASPDQMLIARVLLHTHTHTHSHVRACTRLVLHRRPSYESLDALSRRWISRGTLLQQVHRGAALQSAAGADSAARRPCPRSCVLRNAESRRGIRFALWQTRRQRAVLCIVIDGGSSIRTRRIEQRFRDFSNIFLQSLQIRRRLYFESQGV